MKHTLEDYYKKYETSGINRKEIRKLFALKVEQSIKNKEALTPRIEEDYKYCCMIDGADRNKRNLPNFRSV